MDKLLPMRAYTSNIIIGGNERYYIAEGREQEMLVPESTRTTVAYILYQTPDEERKYAGTCFFLGVDEDHLSFRNTVTARHVIDAVTALYKAGKARDILEIQVNKKEGGIGYVETKLDDWYVKDVDSGYIDVAILTSIPSTEIYDLKILNSDFIQDEATKKKAEYKYGIGDEVIISGLFALHRGIYHKTIPIIRIGNIAMMPDEKVDISVLKEINSQGGKIYETYQINAYLIEARSISGLSGSPVYVHMTMPRRDEKGHALLRPMSVINLIGIIQGHYDVKNPVFQGSMYEEASINSGIAIVVPIEKVLEVINLPELVKERKKIVEENKEYKTTPDTLDQEENKQESITKADFFDVLETVSKPDDEKKDDKE